MAPSLEVSTETEQVQNPNLKNQSSVSISTITTDPSLALAEAVSKTTLQEQPAITFELEDHPIDVTPGLRVAVIGAGLAGITAGVLLPIKVPGISLQIFDKNSDVGGTWVENIYPGVRCDIPANVYQSTFSPNTQWSEEYAQGREIRDYWQGVAKKYEVYKYLKLGRKVVEAVWEEDAGKWRLSVENVQTNEKYTEEFDVIITAIGRFNAWKLPDYPGINDFQGTIRHSSNWDPNFDATGKTVAVIGNGASGIQVVPQLQKVVSRLDHYARSPTWIAGSFGGEGEGRTLEPKYYPPELLQSFADNPETYYAFRKELESKFYKRFGAIFRGANANSQLKEEYKVLMAERLKKKPELLDQLVPDFSPNCRRLTPGPGYLEALTEDNVDFIRTPISHFTKDSIVTTDGTERKVDAVICSTGANSNMHPAFPIVGPKGLTLQTQWTPDPLTYLGVSAPNFPNLLFISGPQGTGHSGTVPQQAETQVTYIAKLLRKVGNQGIKTFVASQTATDDYTAYSDAFFKKTVWTEDCRSWANGGRPGGRIHGHWPGSATHLNFVRREPRWEDWEWKYKTPTGNRFAYFGNGWSNKEAVGEGDLTAYLRLPEKVDLRSYHEDWFEGL